MFKKRNIDEVARCYRACFLDENSNVTLEGSIVLRDMLAFGRIDDTPYDDNPYEMAKNCGRMEFANRVRAMVMTNASVFEQLNELDDMEE